MTSSSYSRRLAAVSGTMVTVAGAVTRQNVPVERPMASRAAGSEAPRRSIDNGTLRNCGSKTRLMPAKRAREVSTSRLPASRNTRESGSVTSGSSRPCGGRARARLMTDSSWVTPSLRTAILVRSAVRVSRTAASASALTGFSSRAIWNSTRASS